MYSYLAPGDVANAGVEPYAGDTTTGNACPREGTLVVTAPNDGVTFESPCPFAVRPSAQWIETFPALNLRA